MGSLSANGRPTGSPEPGEDRVHVGTGDPREPQRRVRGSEPCPAASGPRRACLAAVPPASCQLCRPGHGSVPPTLPRPCVPTQGWGQEAHMGLGPGQLGQCQACPDHCNWWAVGTVGTPGPALGRRCTPRLSTGPGGPRGSSHRDRGWAGEGRSHVLPPGCRTCQQPPPTPAWADRCRPHGPPVAELPVAVEGLQHAAGRLPLGQEQQHRPVPGQALGGTGVTAVGRTRGRGASPGWPAPPRRALPEEGRAGRTPHTRARCSPRPVCPRECWGGAGHLGSWGAWSGGLIRVKDFVPETQGEWPPSRLSCGGHHEANRVPRAWAGGTDLARWGRLVP